MTHGTLEAQSGRVWRFTCWTRTGSLSRVHSFPDLLTRTCISANIQMKVRRCAITIQNNVCTYTICHTFTICTVTAFTLREMPDTRTISATTRRFAYLTDTRTCASLVCSGAFTSHHRIDINITVRASSCGRDVNAPPVPYEEHHTVSHNRHAWVCELMLCVRLQLKNLSRCVMWWGDIMGCRCHRMLGLIRRCAGTSCAASARPSAFSAVTRAALGACEGRSCPSSVSARSLDEWPPAQTPDEGPSPGASSGSPATTPT